MGASLNTMRTMLLLAAMTALFIIVGGLLGGRTGMIMALVFACGTNLFAWWNADRLALAAVGARQVSARDAPDLVALVGALAARAGLPMPRVYLVDNPQPNAFATGRDPAHAAIAVHTGLLQMLDRAALAGVIAHELAHVKNRDTLTMTITATLAGAVSSIAHWGLFFGGRRNGPGFFGALAISVLAPMAAMIVQMAISRSREYEADRLGGTICGNPLDLARALARLHEGASAVPNPAAEAHPAMAPLFIVNPLTGARFDSLFSTHPHIENRIAALETQAAEMGISPATYDTSPGPRAEAESTGWAPFRRRAAGAPAPEAGGGPGSFLGGRGIAPPWRGATRHDNPDSRRPRGPWG